MQNQELSWKMKGFGKGVDPQKVVEELNRISAQYNGALTPENVVAEAKEEDSILHVFFEWNNDKAAEQYRLQQARNLINNIEVKVIHHGEPVNLGFFEVVTVGDNRAYKSLDVLTVQDVEQVRQTTLEDLQILSKKLSFYSEFKSTINHIEKAVKSLKKKSKKKKK